MLKIPVSQKLCLSLIAVVTLLGVSINASAKTTINPVEMRVSGGYTVNIGVSNTTQLFLDYGERGEPTKFWVRVESDPGTPYDQRAIDTPDGDVVPIIVEEPIVQYIKYFPISRYLEVMRAIRGIQNFGTVNPYIDGAIICDLPNVTIRTWNRRVNMAYNCGAADSPDADAATFSAEDLLNALRVETTSSPDLTGELYP